MCRDQSLISETDVRTDERTDERADKRMKIEKPGVGRPLLGPAKMTSVCPTLYEQIKLKYLVNLSFN